MSILDGTIKCSCMKFEETGSFCAMQANLASTVHQYAGVPFHGFEIRDVALRYNSAFMHMAYKIQHQKMSN